MEDYWAENQAEDYSKYEPQQGVATVKNAVTWVGATGFNIRGVQPSDEELQTRLTSLGFNRNDKEKREVMDEAVLLIMKWGWEGQKKEVSALQVEEGEGDLEDPPIPKCGSGSVNDPTSSCDRWSYESKCKAFWDLLIINGLIAVTCFWALFSFVKFNNGESVQGLSILTVIVFIPEIFMTINQVYRDDMLKLHVGYDDIFKNYCMSWFLIDAIALAGAIVSLGTAYTVTDKQDPTSGATMLLYNQNCRYWKLFELLRLFKLLSMHRMRRLAGSISGDPRRPHAIMMKVQQVFAALVWIMVIVLSIMAAMNAADVQKVIDVTPTYKIQEVRQKK